MSQDVFCIAFRKQAYAGQIDDNTLVIFHSDNGAAPNQGGSSGPLRGLKFQEWEGGVRAPAIVRWPAAFKGGRVINQVMGYIDIAPTLREIAGVRTSPPKPYDGISMLSVWKGKKKMIRRDFYLGYGSLLNNEWKIVTANAGNPKMKEKEDQLFAIMKDPSEKANLTRQQQQVYEKLHQTVAIYDSIKPMIQVAPYAEGRKGFKAPKDWKIE